MAHMMVQPRPRRALKRFLVILLVIFLLLLACAGFIVVKALISPTSAFSSTVPILPDADGSTGDPEAKQLAALTDKGYTYNDDIVNILLLGLDSNAAREADHAGWRSDVMIIAAINTRTKAIKLVSIPRDTYTKVNKVNADGEIASTQNNKINAAFAFGGGPSKYSYQNAVAAVRHLMKGIPIHGYAGVDMDGFSELIDSMGGVTLEITDDMSKRDPDFPAKGTTATLSGDQALKYVRERYTTAGGDTGRSRRQRELLTAILATGQKQGMVAFATKCLATMSDDVTTSLSFDQIITLAAIAGGTDLSTLESITLDGENGRSESNASIFRVNEEKLESLILDIWMVEK